MFISALGTDSLQAPLTLIRNLTVALRALSIQRRSRQLLKSLCRRARLVKLLKILSAPLASKGTTPRHMVGGPQICCPQEDRQ